MTNNKNNHASIFSAGKILLTIILLFALLGFAVSVHLSSIHYNTHTNPNYHSTCAINEKINCESVAQSPYSVFAGMPISAWGIIAYLVISILAAWGLSKQSLHSKWPGGILFFMFLAAITASACLAYVSFFRIDSMCIWCMSLYGTNFILFVLGVILAIVNKNNPVAAFLKDIKAVFKKPKKTIALAVTVLTVTIAAMVAIPPYWQHVGWKEIPTLPTGVTKNGTHWVGSPNPLVTVIEFSDYQCPHCRRAHKNMRAIIGKHSKQVRLVHKHWPMDTACNSTIKTLFHQRACEFAKAAECAARQNQFWQMNDAVFSIQDHIKAKEINLDELAIQLGLDRPQFNKCMNSDLVMPQIQKNIKEGNSRGVHGTPTFFIGGRPYPGGFTEKILTAAIKKATAKGTAKGTL